MKKEKKKIPKKERFVRWLIKRWLPDYHLHKSPPKKRIEVTKDISFRDCRFHNLQEENLPHPSGESPALGEADS